MIYNNIHMTLKRYSDLLFKFTKNPNIKDDFVQKFIPKNFHRFLIKEKPLPLGRWSIPKKVVNKQEEYNYEQIHDKANMANFDHCDPCGREFNPTNFEKK